MVNRRNSTIFPEFRTNNNETRQIESVRFSIELVRRQTSNTFKICWKYKAKKVSYEHNTSNSVH